VLAEWRREVIISVGLLIASALIGGGVVRVLWREVDARSAAEQQAAAADAARQIAETRAALAGELERKNSELEAFSYSVSHDLRSPLRSIHGFVDIFLQEHEPVLTDRGRGHLNRVRGAAKRMSEIIDALLELSKVGRAELVRTRVDVSDIARRIVDDLTKKDPHRVVTSVIEPSLVADADPRLIRIALENLLGNAWKFTASTTMARIEFGRTVRGDGPAYFVRDNGAGFEVAYADKLFRPFQRLHTEQEFPGTGIGLATVGRIIARHGGRVDAESTLGAGATFYFTLGPTDVRNTAVAAEAPTTTVPSV
jgi:light-regulated signal transduction histidine kinase (bacteriophytochrome)